jgi:hypothetical protein
MAGVALTRVPVGISCQSQIDLQESHFITVGGFTANPTGRFWLTRLKPTEIIGLRFIASLVLMRSSAQFHFMTDRFHFMSDKFHLMPEPTGGVGSGIK